MLHPRVTPPSALEWTAPPAPTLGDGWHPLHAVGLYVAMHHLRDKPDDPLIGGTVRTLRGSTSAVLDYYMGRITGADATTSEGMGRLLAYPITSRDLPMAYQSMGQVVAIYQGTDASLPFSEPVDTAKHYVYSVLKHYRDTDGIVRYAPWPTPVAHVWYQRTSKALKDGEPQAWPEAYLAVDLTATIEQITSDPHRYIVDSTGDPEIVSYVFNRMTKLRMVGRKPYDAQQRREATQARKAKGATLFQADHDAAIAALKAEHEQLMARAQETYAGAANAMSAQIANSVNMPYAAGLIVEIIKLMPDTHAHHVNPYAMRIQQEHPALFAAIANALRAGS